MLGWVWGWIGGCFDKKPDPSCSAPSFCLSSFNTLQQTRSEEESGEQHLDRNIRKADTLSCEMKLVHNRVQKHKKTITISRLGDMHMLQPLQDPTLRLDNNHDEHLQKLDTKTADRTVSRQHHCWGETQLYLLFFLSGHVCYFHWSASLLSASQ